MIFLIVLYFIFIALVKAMFLTMTEVNKYPLLFAVYSVILIVIGVAIGQFIIDTELASKMLITPNNIGMPL